MKKLFLATLICAIISLGLIGCAKQAGTGTHSGDEHPKSEHPK